MAKSEEISRGKIFSEFFTNLAVATLSAGIVVPIFTSTTFSLNLFVLSIIAAMGLMASAIMIKDLK